MRIKSRMVEVTWREFDVGEFARRTSHRSGLFDDGVYQVVRCEPPVAGLETEGCCIRVKPIAGGLEQNVYDGYLIACDENGWRASDEEPWDSDYPPGAPEWPRVLREVYEANGYQWPKKSA
jgi:hypothetical protein